MSTDQRRHRLHDHSDDNSGGRLSAQHITGLAPAATGSTSTSSGGAAVLNDLGDVDLVTTPPVDNDALTYDATTGQWVPAPAGSGATFIDLGWFNVEDYGAVHDGVTDDTAAIQATIAACYAAGGGTIWFPEGIYLIAGALVSTGTYNSQLTIPTNTSGLVSIRFLGSGSTENRSTLRTNWAGAISGTPSMLSAGTHDSVTLNQVFVVFEHMRVEAPPNPKLTAIDMTKAATFRWVDFAIGINGTVTTPSNTNAVGLDLPWGLNDQNSGGDALWVDGFYVGLRPSEQMIAEAVYATRCAQAVQMRGSQGSPNYLAHSATIHRLNVWYSIRGIVFTGDYRTLNVTLMDVEHNDPSWTTVYDVDDASNYGRGFIRLHTTDYTTGTAIDDPLINGAAGISFHFPHIKRWRLASTIEVPIGTDPSTNAPSGFTLYAASATGKPTTRSAAGTVTTLMREGDAAGGDLSGTYPNPSVVDDSHSHTAATLPATTSGTGGHVHVAEEIHLSNGSTTTYTLDAYYEPGSVVAWNRTTLARLLVTEVLPDQVTVSAAGTSGDQIIFDYAATLI